jgi:NMT1-like family
MGRRGLQVLVAILLSLSIGVIGLAGCNGDGAPETPTEPVSPTEATGFQWPDKLHIAGPGQSGMVKYVSWVNVMMEDIDVEMRVVPEANASKVKYMVASGEYFIGQASKSGFRNYFEALEELAQRDWGPFHARIVWVHSLANSGFFVRGDSEIQTIYDLKPGLKFATWNMKASTLNPPRSLLAWIELDEEDIHWVDCGTFEGAQRAVVEGRADIVFCFPTSPTVYEQAGAPHGIRFLDLDAVADPEGARRWQERNPLYSFAPMDSGVPEAIGVWGTVGYIFDFTRVEADPDLVYHFAKWLDENFDRYKDTHDSNQYMTIEHMMLSLETTYIPVHEGLIRYLDEKGLWTEAHATRQAENIAIFDMYIDAWNASLAQADAQGIEVSPLNPDWIMLWETYKVDNEIPKLGMHISITESGVVIVPTEVPELPTETPTPTETVVPTGPVHTGDVPIEIVSIPEECWVNDIMKIEIKTEPNAELHLEMFLSDGVKSGFPKDPNRVADADGVVVWEWALFKHTPAGATKIDITATVGDKTGKITTYFICLK